MKFCEPCAKFIAKKVEVTTIALTGEFVERRTCDYCKTPNVLCAGMTQTNPVRVVPRRKQRGIAMMMVVYLIGAVAILGILATGVYKIHKSGYEKGKAEIQLAWDQAKAEQRAKEEKQINTATVKHEAQREKTRTVYRTITKSVDKYIDRPVYRNVCFDTDGMRDANAALRGTGVPAGKPDPAMPATDGTGKRDGSGGTAKAD